MMMNDAPKFAKFAFSESGLSIIGGCNDLIMNFLSLVITASWTCKPISYFVKGKFGSVALEKLLFHLKTIDNWITFQNQIIKNENKLIFDQQFFTIWLQRPINTCIRLNFLSIFVSEDAWKCLKAKKSHFSTIKFINFQRRLNPSISENHHGKPIVTDFMTIRAQSFKVIGYKRINLAAQSLLTVKET